MTAERSVRYGGKVINYRLSYAGRKTLKIAVCPDCSVEVEAPAGADIALIEERLVRRARWILRQRDFFRRFHPRTPPRCYVNGETHLYLGRRYRLRAARGAQSGVKLADGYLCVTTRAAPAPAAVKKALDAWYLQKARACFAEGVARCRRRFDGDIAAPPALCVRRMRSRWGSLSPRGRLTLNTDLIRAPKECIDYVITHELCHLRHYNHGAGFYRLLDSVMPDWKRIKDRLETTLA